MNRLGRLVRAAANPASTAATRWWCHSALRRWLTGYGPTASQRRVTSHGASVTRPGAAPGGFARSADQKTDQMRARAKAIDDLLG